MQLLPAVVSDSWPPHAWNGASLQFFSALLAGHVLAEFVLQIRQPIDAERSREEGSLPRHFAGVALIQIASLGLFALSLGSLVTAIAVALVHTTNDAVRTWLSARFGKRPLSWLLANQLIHVFVLFMASSLLASGNGATGEPDMQSWWWRHPLERIVPPDVLARALFASALLGFSAAGGSAIVSILLKRLSDSSITTDSEGPGTAAAPDPGAGRLIGALERYIVLGLVWAGQWGAVGLVLTAKSVARFKRMDDQAFAEIYLVGTMTSMLIAALCGLVLRMAFGPLA